MLLGSQLRENVRHSEVLDGVPPPGAPQHVHVITQYSLAPQVIVPHEAPPAASSVSPASDVALGASHAARSTVSATLARARLIARSGRGRPGRAR